MKALIESMTKLHVRGWTFRIWREEPKLEHVRSREELDAAFVHAASVESAAVAIAVRMFNIDRVNAVEFVDTNGNGTVIYKDWP